LLGITRWCRGTRRKLVDTEDLTHDAWIRAQSRNQPLDLSTPEGWAYFARVCRSIQVDWARRVQRLEAVKEDLASTGKGSAEDPAPKWMRILDIHDALCEMHDSSIFGARYSQIVEFRYFVGFDL